MLMPAVCCTVCLLDCSLRESRRLVLVCWFLCDRFSKDARELLLLLSFPCFFPCCCMALFCVVTMMMMMTVIDSFALPYSTFLLFLVPYLVLYCPVYMKSHCQSALPRIKRRKEDGVCPTLFEKEHKKFGKFNANYIPCGAYMLRAV